MSLTRFAGMDGDRLLLVVLSRWWWIAVAVAIGWWIAVAVAIGWWIAVVMVGLRIVSWRRACLGWRRGWVTTIDRRWRIMMVMIRSTIGTIAASIDVGFGKIYICNFITAENKQYPHLDYTVFEKVYCFHGVLLDVAHSLHRHRLYCSRSI